MNYTTADLMNLVARLRSGEGAEAVLATVPSEQRETLSQIISIVVVGVDGQLEGIQPVDYSSPQRN